ncbi:MAG: pyridoxine/pyridoxamine 5'-phosphate oxidase [Gemmatimonadales bacterium]|nr:MAG: pyridoxine/pyridoxamine 5'-phosphate oxidase [Gemmatimonadales bacterium]
MSRPVPESAAEAGLNEEDLDPDPIKQFQLWFAEVQAAGIPEPTAMILATADREGRPSARTVLLKSVDRRGFVFYTNYESRKGKQLEENPRAALVFNWPQLRRQVCIEGSVSKVSREESEAYFKTRPRGHQLGAWASRQSSVVSSREELDRRLAALEIEYRGKEIPLPPYWGGYLVAPERIEFWQGRANRMHDRLVYRRQGDGWVVERLSP